MNQRDAKITLKDVATSCGYAVSTVSQVLNGDPRCYASDAVKERIRRTAKELGYRPNFFASSLRRQRSFQIGVAGSLFGNQISSHQMRSLIAPLKAAGYGVLFEDTLSEVDREKAAFHDLVHKRVEGILLKTVASDDTLKQIITSEVPCLLFTDREVPGLVSLVIDRAAAYEAAAERLLSLGHRRIAYMGNLEHSNATKVLGYRRAMTRAGLFDERLLVECWPEPGQRREFVIAHPELFRTITAVLAMDDRVAAETVVGLGRIGLKVPRDVSIVGFDDTDVVHAVEPPLTSLRQPRDEVGTTAARMLLDCIAGRPVENAVLVPQWVERESVAACTRRVG